MGYHSQKAQSAPKAPKALKALKALKAILKKDVRLQKNAKCGGNFVPSKKASRHSLFCNFGGGAIKRLAAQKNAKCGANARASE